MAVVRGDVVLVALLEFPTDTVEEGLSQAAAFVTNMTFAQGESGFNPQSLRTVSVPTPGKPLVLHYPSNWSLGGDGFSGPGKGPPGTIVLYNGPPKSNDGVATFAFSSKSTREDPKAWATRVLNIYLAEMAERLSNPMLLTSFKVTPLENSDASGDAFVWSLDDSALHKKVQLKVVVVARNDERYTITLLTLYGYDNLRAFLNYETGRTTHDLMVEDLLTHLVGHGF